MIKIEVGRKEDDLQELLRSKEPSSFDNSKQFAILKLTDGCMSRVSTTAKQQPSELINIEFSFVFLSFTELRFAKLCYILFSYYQLIAAHYHHLTESIEPCQASRPLGHHDLPPGLSLAGSPGVGVAGRGGLCQ